MKTLHLSDETHRKLKFRALEEGKDVRQIAEEIILVALKTPKQKKGKRP